MKNRKEKEKIRSDESDGEGNGGNRTLSDKEQQQIEAVQLKMWCDRLGIGIDADILKAWNQYGFDAIRSAGHRFEGAKPPVQKSVFLSVIQEEGNRL